MQCLSSTPFLCLNTSTTFTSTTVVNSYRLPVELTLASYLTTHLPTGDHEFRYRWQEDGIKESEGKSIRNLKIETMRNDSYILGLRIRSDGKIFAVPESPMILLLTVTSILTAFTCWHHKSTARNSVNCFTLMTAAAFTATVFILPPNLCLFDLVDLTVLLMSLVFVILSTRCTGRMETSASASQTDVELVGYRENHAKVPDEVDQGQE